MMSVIINEKTNFISVHCFESLFSWKYKSTSIQERECRVFVKVLRNYSVHITQPLFRIASRESERRRGKLLNKAVR